MAGQTGKGYIVGMAMHQPPLEDLRRRRFRRIPVRTLAPNLVTLLALCAGLTGIRMAFENRYALALAAIVFAAILDGLDGRLARFLKGTSRFGAELDSLADFVNFGVAPALIVYFWGLHAEIELRRRYGTGDAAHASVGRRNNNPLTCRRHPRRIAEEIDAPQRRHRREPAERRPQPEQHQRHERECPDEGITLGMDRGEL